MLDGPLRRALRPSLDVVAGRLLAAGATAGGLTAVGLLVGVAACVAAAAALWPLALGLWLVNRTLDGLDGAVARRRGPTDLGGMLDFVADFVVYAGFVVGVAVALPDARLACVVLLATYLLNNVALLSFASIVERRGLDLGDERSLRLTRGLAEGTETIACYVLICLLPDRAAVICWAFAAVVLVTALQRVRAAIVLLGDGASSRDVAAARGRGRSRHPPRS